MLSKVFMGYVIRIHAGVQNFRISCRSSNDAVHPSGQGSAGCVKRLLCKVHLSQSIIGRLIHMRPGICIVLGNGLLRHIIISPDRCFRRIIIRQDLPECFRQLIGHILELLAVIAALCPEGCIRNGRSRRNLTSGNVTVTAIRLQYHRQHFVFPGLYPLTAGQRDDTFSYIFRHDKISSLDSHSSVVFLWDYQGGDMARGLILQGRSTPRFSSLKCRILYPHQ